jgi:hypothetical protein
MVKVDRRASPYAGLRSASVRENTDERNNQRIKLHAKSSKDPFPPPRSGFVQPGCSSGRADARLFAFAASGAARH